jgi:hypothetical protein
LIQDPVPFGTGFFAFASRLASGGRHGDKQPVNRFSLLIILAWLVPFVVPAQTQEAPPLRRAHAHNDYAHARPLADALAHGFRSVEADIWLTNGALLVAHDFQDTTPDRTLQKLYLDPLREFVSARPRAHGEPPFTLMIDVKSDAEKTYAVLREVLRGYADMLTRLEPEKIHTNAIMVIISGARAEGMMRAEPNRLAALDGRLPDLAFNAPPALVPLISDNWTKHFQWRGTGAMSETEKIKLRQLVERAHAQGKRIRFWAVPDREAGWKELLDAGVDLINTDKLAELEKFLRAQAAPARP